MTRNRSARPGIQFWRSGYADTSLDDLSRATGLNRSSIYSSLGAKGRALPAMPESLRRALRREIRRSAVVCSLDPLAAVRAFFDVTLERMQIPRYPTDAWSPSRPWRFPP
jgi:AcrR family transcriptional regulator